MCACFVSLSRFCFHIKLIALLLTLRCDTHMALSLKELVCFSCMCQAGESGGEAAGMGTQEPAGGGGAARLLHGALSRP